MAETIFPASDERVTGLGDLGDFERVRELLERALAIEERTFGGDHPEVAITRVNLGHGERSRS